MKHLRTVLTILSIYFLGSPHMYAQGTDTDPQLTQFISDFKSAVLKHDMSALLDMMDPTYRMEQHDKLHRGNTKRFMNELFCGNIFGSENFSCMKLKRIRRIETLSTGEGDKDIPVAFRVSNGKISIDAYLTIHVIIQDGIRSFGIVAGLG